MERIANSSSSKGIVGEGSVELPVLLGSAGGLKDQLLAPLGAVGVRHVPVELTGRLSPEADAENDWFCHRTPLPDRYAGPGTHIILATMIRTRSYFR